MTPVIVPATDEHALDIAPRLRIDSAEEVYRVGLLSPLEAARGSLAASISAYAWIVNGHVGCLFGVAGDTIGQAVMPWLLTTDEVTRYRKTFWRHSREIVRLMKEASPLEGYCDARFSSSVRWLKRLGFELHGPVPLGAMQVPAYHFRMR